MHPASLRLHIAARSLGVDSVVARVLFRVSEVSPTAAWVWNKTKGKVEIHVSPRMLDGLLSNEELSALLRHELAHLTGLNSLLRLRGLNPLAANLAFDCALEKVLDRVIGPALRSLNDRLMLQGLNKTAAIAASDALCLVIHSQPPLERMPLEHQLVWKYLWAPDVMATPERCFQAMLPLVQKSFPDGDRQSPSAFTLVVDGTGEPEELILHGMPEGQQLSEPVKATLETVTCTIAGNVSWLRPQWIEPAKVDSAATEALRVWLGHQDGDAQVSECLDRVLDGLGTEQLSLPYLIAPTRRELTRRALGIPAVTFSNKLPVANSLVMPIYCDCSGSMHIHLETIVSILKAIEARAIASDIFAFDTVVTQLESHRAVQGHIAMGCGTSYDAAITHALDRGATDALFLTDGEDVVSSSLQKAVAKAGLRLRAVMFGGCESQPWWWAVHRWN